MSRVDTRDDLDPGEHPLRVFVCSTIDPQLERARELTREAIGKAPYLAPWLFEYTPASSEDLLGSYLDKVRQSDLVIWLVGDDTTDPVRQEVEAALASGRRLLVFRLPSSERTSSTRDLLKKVGPHSKWLDVEDVERLPHYVELTLHDEIVRAVRGSGGAESRERYLEQLGRASRGRCIARWQSAGMPLALAIELADDPSVGAVGLDGVHAGQKVQLLVGPIGAGKSLAAERLLQGALADSMRSARSPLPVYLDTPRLSGGLGRAVAEELGRVEGTADEGAVVVVDGLEALGSPGAVKLLEEARTLCHSHPNTSVFLTSRPTSTLARAEELVPLPELSPDDSIRIISLSRGSEVTPYSMVGWPSSLKSAVRRPLFAVLAGSYLRSVNLQPASVVAVITDVVESVLVGTDVDGSRTTALASIAARSVELGLSPVHAADCGLDSTERQALVYAGLITDDGYSVQFSLPVFAQWYAAQWLLAGNAPDVTELSAVEAWSTSVAIAVGTGGYDAVFETLQRIAERYPGVAAEIIDDALARWGDESELDAAYPSEADIARIRATMVSWIRGLGPLGRLIGPINARGRLAPLAASTSGSRLSTAWYFGEEEIDESTPVPVEAFRGAAPWALSLSAAVGRAPSWPWRWSLETLRFSLENTLATRTLPTRGTFLAREAAWVAALGLVDRGNLDHRPIPLKILEEELDRLPQDTQVLNHIGRRLKLYELRQAMEELKSEGAASMVPPLPGPDLGFAGGWVWSGYSESRLRERTIAVYEAALRAFSHVIGLWFGGLLHAMPRALLMPVSMVATLYLPGKTGAVGPSIDYYLEPLEETAESRVELRVDPPSAQGDFGPPESFYVAVRRYRSAYMHRVYPTRTRSVLGLFGPDPVTRLVYRWLWEDLEHAGWLSGPAPYEESRGMIGAKLAGFRVVSLAEGAPRTNG